MSTTFTAAPAGTWNADPVHSHLQFEIDYAGTNVFRGGFNDYTATVEDGVLEGVAKVASVDVKDEQLNGHLQSPDFFDAARFPEITFRATELVKESDGSVRASGELTLKGVTKPVELTGRIGSPQTDPFGREKLGLTLQTTVDRNDYGISWNMPNQAGGGNYLGDDVTLVANLVFAKQA